MKKTCRKLTFAAAIAGTAVAAALTACHETVYGPPEMPAGESRDPASEIPETVYGPPEDLQGEEPAGSRTGLTAMPAETEEEIIPAALYGPPPDDLEKYDPEAEIPEDVYGPPGDNW